MNIEDWKVVIEVLETAEENAVHRLEEEKQSRLASLRVNRIKAFGEELMEVRRALHKCKAELSWAECQKVTAFPVKAAKDSQTAGSVTVIIEYGQDPTFALMQEALLKSKKAADE
jgi:hypothetical protein